jgi:hypothetical protein
VGKSNGGFLAPKVLIGLVGYHTKVMYLGGEKIPLFLPAPLPIHSLVKDDTVAVPLVSVWCRFDTKAWGMTTKELVLRLLPS